MCTELKPVVPPQLSLSDAEQRVFTMIDGMIVTTFMVVVTRGNHPPDLLADSISHAFRDRLYQCFLRSAAHECVLKTHCLSELSPPSDRCWPLPAYSFRSTRAIVLLSMFTKNTSEILNCQRKNVNIRCDSCTVFISISCSNRTSKHLDGITAYTLEIAPQI